MAEQRDYNKWTKESLLKRVKWLEDELVKRKTSTATGTADEDLEELETNQKLAKKAKKAIDPSNYSTRFIALKLAYLGKNYNGFEYQVSGQLPSIEEEVWKALVKCCLIFPTKPDEVDFNICEYSKCGRTDRGVSAFGQVVALRVRSNKALRKKEMANSQADPLADTDDRAVATLQDGGPVENMDAQKLPDEAPCPVEDEIQYCRTLNRLLPPDIRVLAWCPVPPPDFSARFSCRERQYRYFFTQPAFAPMPQSLDSTPTGGRSTTMKEGWLDLTAMRSAAQKFVGVHDFRNFCKVDPNKQITNFTRRIFESEIVEVPNVDSALPYLSRQGFKSASITKDGVAYPKVYSFNVNGSAFLWHQIRHMVAILFLVGQGLESPALVDELLDVEKQPRRPNYLMAEETPLVLWDCVFPTEDGLGRKDALNWAYADDRAQCLHGSAGLVDQLWKGWHEKKMDEILANRLLDWTTARVDASECRIQSEKQNTGSQKVFEGGGAPRFTGSYVPVMQKPLMPSPDVVNDKWAQRKGFANSEELKSLGNWRAVMKERKSTGESKHEGD